MSEQFDLPTLVPFREEIKTVIGGGGHTFIQTRSNELYGCGWNANGQLGLPATEAVTSFQKVPHHFDVISAGWDVSGGILSGECFIWGNNSHQQFGNQNQQKFSSIPVALPCKDDKVLGVSFGLRHTALQLPDRVRVFGKSKYFGKENSDILTPSLRVVSGQHHIVIQKNSRDLLLLGDNKFGQCGEFATYSHTQEITQIFAGWTHSGLLDCEGNVFMWGRNNYFQLGHSTVQAFSKKPLKVEVPGRVVQVQSGSEHVVAVTEDGSIYSWGWNEHKNCGVEALENVSTPTKVKIDGFCKGLGVGAGFTFTVVERR